MFQFCMPHPKKAKTMQDRHASQKRGCPPWARRCMELRYWYSLATSQAGPAQSKNDTKCFITAGYREQD